MNGITANVWYETSTGHPYPNTRAAVRERTLAAVKAVLDEGGDIPEIAARLGVTRDSARRLYVAATGHRHPNCMAARRERRLAAAQAILDGGGTVTDISVRLRIGGSDARNLYLAATGHLPPQRGTRTREQDR
jgi:methylphosphotriester-DNA--protein-cysteine methyltransferase